MSAQGGPNSGVRGGTKRAKKSQKLNLPKSPSDAFETFIDQGNVFDVRDKTKKIQRFIPKTPSAGLESSFDVEKFSGSSGSEGKRIGKLFKFDF